MRKIPQGAGLYLAVLELVFALGWTVYAIYLPRLAASAGIAAGAVIYILMLDQAIFTVTDFAMGVASDKVSRLVGRLGHWVAAITALSCAAFVALPFVAGTKLGPTALLVLIVIWAVTSSALRAPPLMLLGKYAARPAIPYLMSLAMLGLGIAGAVSPYLAITLAKQDPRLPFVIASVALVLTSLALAKVERSLAKDAPAKPEPPKTVDRAIPVIVFALATVIFALGFQLHFFFNSAPRFKQFTSDVSTLMPVFWVGFSVAMFPASLITKRWGGLPVMGAIRIHRRHRHRGDGIFRHVRSRRRGATDRRRRLGLHPDERVLRRRRARLHRRRRQNHRRAVLRAGARHFCADGDDRERRAERPVAGAAAALGADCVLGDWGHSTDSAVTRRDATRANTLADRPVEATS